MSSTSTAERAETVLRTAIAELGPDPEDVTLDATFVDLDLDSLDFVELRQVIEEELGVVLRREELKDLRCVRDVVELVAAKAG